MFKNFIVSEFKKYLRDPMMKFLFFYPLVFGLIGRYALPIIADNSGFSIERYADLILVILTLFTPHIYGALIGFSILDDRDDHILTSIKTTPLGINQFLSIRIAMAFVLCFLGTIFVMWFSNIGNISMINMIALAFLASLAAPMTGLFINAISSNKIEGFAVMKGSGTILVFPILALFFIDKKEFFFSFAPGFWPAKAISSLIRGEGLLQLSYSQYYLIGLVYVIILNILVYNIFLRKTQTD